MSAGEFHTLLLRSDGAAVACGGIEPPATESEGPTRVYISTSDGVAAAGAAMLIPDLDGDTKYIQAAAGNQHTVLLRSDGTVVSFGRNSEQQCTIQGKCADIKNPGQKCVYHCQTGWSPREPSPVAHSELKYVQVATSKFHTVALMSDGTALVCGNNIQGQCVIPALEEGAKYTQVAAGMFSTALLRSDGAVVACGDNWSGNCNIPALDRGLEYTQVDAGGSHTVLLRSDGAAITVGNLLDRHATPVECGDNGGIPALEAGVTYVQVAVGQTHTVLLRSDGTAVACGNNTDGQCDIPGLDGIEKYVQVIAGQNHTVLLRSDGSAVACGDNKNEQCNLPALDGDLKYMPSASSTSRLLVQLQFDKQSSEVVSCLCCNLAGEKIGQIDIGVEESLELLQGKLTSAIGVARVVLPTQDLLEQMDLSAKVSSLLAD